jgi:hypothetical protein
MGATGSRRRIRRRRAQEAEQPQGFRAWLVESRIGFGDSKALGYGRQRATEFGQRLEYRRETLNYGEFVLQADGRHLSGDSLVSGGSIGSLGYARERPAAASRCATSAFRSPHRPLPTARWATSTAS